MAAITQSNENIHAICQSDAQGMKEIKTVGRHL